MESRTRPPRACVSVRRHAAKRHHSAHAHRCARDPIWSNPQSRALRRRNVSGMPRLLGISHIDLTVSDCDRAATWWRDVMGFTLVNQVSQQTYECRSLIHPSGVAVTVMTHDGTAEAGPFDERRVGLDHLAFQITDPAELQQWVTHLDELGVPHSGSSTPATDRRLVFRDPDNIQLEFYVHPESGRHDVDRRGSPEAQRLLRDQ